MTFPTTPILDDFNRPDEGPPPSANWTTGFVSEWTAGLRVNGNEVSQWGGDGGAVWNTPYGPDCEIYFTASAVPASFLCYWRSYSTDSTHTYGYRFYVYTYLGQLFMGVDQLNGLSGSQDILWSNLGGDPVAAGDKFGVSHIDDTITVYKNIQGAGWVVVTTITNNVYSSANYLSIGINGASGRIDDFGGGTFTSGLVADFSGTPLVGGAPLSVAFTDTSTGSPTSWLWDFGDSTSSTVQNPTHIYSADGIYTVALTATNIDGDDTETKVDYITVASPVADFSGTPTSGTVPLSVAFTDASTNAPTSWFWDFGDGGSSTDQDPTYIYNYIGTYTVTLIASNGSGSDSETKVAYITVTAVVEYGAAVIENCDIDTGGAAVGLRVADVTIARDNRLGSVTVDASAELRAKDNSYTTLVNNGTLQPLAGDRAAFDAIGYAARHTNDADDSVTAIHHTLGTGADQAAAGDHAHAGMGTVTNIATGTGLTGGPITTTGTISDANTGVAAATYGDASNIPQIAVNAQGRITSAANIAISTFTPINVYNETQTADGVSLIYYLINYAAPSTIRVYIDGIRQPASDDTDPTDVVTFDVAPDLGAVLLFDYEMDTA